MLSYKGIPCPVCNKPFNDEDDIVVCPECGAPYHRHCYEEKGACIFPDLHATHTSWEAPKQEEPTPQDTAYEVRDNECPRCGTLNPHSASFCNTCGTRLTGAQQNTPPYGYQNPNMNNPNNANTYGGMYGVQFNPFDPMGGVDPTEKMDEDVTYGEASKLVQVNTRYFMQSFKRMNTLKSNKFNFSAFLFSGGYLLYRKMYKQGIITSAIMFLLYMVRLFLMMFFIYPIEQSAMNTLSGEFSYADLTAALSNAMANDNTILIVSGAVVALTLAMFGVMIFCGAKANRMYMKHCADTIKKTREESENTTVYEEKIHMKGGSNTAIAVVMIICYMLVSYLPGMFM
ncbi:MAG: RING finger protein [Clostridia bacterium]|nr:RING finger protein [Clostridia bacterium]